jgi:hypothetical protein
MNVKKKKIKSVYKSHNKCMLFSENFFTLHEREKKNKTKLIS